MQRKSTSANVSSTFAFTTRRPVAITMVVLAVVVFGLISYFLLALNLMPDITYPSVTVRTEYEGAAPEEVETVVSRPIEQELGIVGNLQNIISISKAGQSDVILEFAWDADINEAISDVREKLDQVFLPPEIERPIILRYDPTLDPIMRIGVYGEESLFYLRRISEEEIKRALEQIPGIAAVKVKGGLEEEIRVEIVEQKLALTELNITQVKNRLSQENINLAGGTLKEGETEYFVRTLNEFTGLDEMQALIVGYIDATPVYLQDIARVYKTNKEREIVTKIDGSEAVEIEIYKAAEANIVEVASFVRQRLFGPAEQPADNGGRAAGLAADVPPGVNFTILSDQSIFIENSIAEVRSAALTGGLLAVLVLLVFLRNFRSTVIVALSIPISILATFAPMNVMDVTLNIMSLGGLALGIGMLVDNSIVVLESIFRCREEGDDFTAAVIRGTSEVGGAVIASTLTTIAVFFPIIFVKGVAGQIFGDMALTIVFSLLASLGVALVFIPMLASLGGDKQQADGVGPGRVVARREGPSLWVNPSFFSVAVDFFKRAANKAWPNGFFSKVSGVIRLLLSSFVALFIFAFGAIFFAIGIVFRVFFAAIVAFVNLIGQLAGFTVVPILDWLLNHVNRWITFLANEYYPRVLRRVIVSPLRVSLSVFIPAILLGFYAISNMGTTLIPEVHQGEFFVEMTYPVGTPVEETARRLDQLESFLMADPAVAKVATVAGTDKSAASTADEGENTAKITVRLVPSSDNESAEAVVIEALREQMARIPGVQYKISRPVLFSFKSPIELQLQAYNLEELRRYSEAVRDRLRLVDELRDVKSSIQAGNPEVQIRFDRAKLAAYGLNVFDVAGVVRNKVRGDVPTEFKDRDRKIDIRVKVSEADKSSLAALRRLRINPQGDVSIPLAAVADIVLDEGPSQIRRESQQRTGLITANLRSGVSLSAATSAINAVLSEMDMPADMDWRIAGQNKEMETSMNSLYLALALAIFLVYIVMASQFESFLHPFVIIFSIPLAFVGVLLFLFLLNIPLSVVVFLGLIMLAGIVVNNAIVLVDYINQLRLRGLAREEAVVQAGQARLRPILMTTLTTVLGLLPLAIGLGDGAEIRAPMAITVVAGLSISTLLTLIVIPTVYLLLDRKEEEAHA
jgi:HAE1 family hydrophobic/amphiphilic exporter-1